MSEAFPGGVRDPEGRRGFVTIAPNRVAAVDLADGKLLWMKDEAGQPIGATGEQLITIGHGKDGPVIRIIDAASGGESKKIADPGLPDWAGREALAGEALHIDATIENGELRLAWKGGQPYRGGAAPTNGIIAESVAGTAGGVFVDLASGRISQVPSGAEAAVPMAAPESPQDFATLAKSIPDAVAMSRVGDRIFVLRNATLPGNALRIEIEARDARTGAVQWQTSLAEVNRGRPTPLRK
ncbi:MAG: PQQ-binding-like beta-propeller repeat protein [Rhizobiales bacterium]|nr:PQQ-binding-like beta-propeller repeat protein [Hyphomicrobiales bacterium]